MKKSSKRNLLPYKKLWHLLRLSLVLLLVAQINILAAETMDVKQAIQITGTVIDENGLPMPGANVTVKGTTTGVVTDVDGKYSINIPNRNATLQFSFVGYLTEEIVVGNQSTVSMQLRPDAIEIDDVVVIGYGTMKKSDVTGSVASVASEDLIKRNPPTLAEGLQGMAAGVHITRNSGSPDGEIQVRIRGTSTINNSTQPIWVVDGIMVGTSASWLNPNDVESIEILKDASATAIYGSRGANGVVLVTTKKGQKGRANLTVSANFGLQTPTKFMDVGNAQEFAEWSNAGEANANGRNPVWSDPAALNSIDWQDEMTRMAWRQQYNVSVMGGADKVRAMMSIGYMDYQGIVIESGMKRINARANVNFDVTDFLTTGLSVTYMHSENKGGMRSNIFSYAQLVPTMDTFDVNKNLVHVPVQYADGTWGHFPRENGTSAFNTSDNPVAAAKTRTESNSNNRMLTNANVDITFFKGFKMTNIFGMNLWTDNNWQYTPRHIRTWSGNKQDRLTFTQRHRMEYSMENYFTFDRTWGKHHPTIMVGYYAYKYDGAEANPSAAMFSGPNIRDLALSTDPTTIAIGTSRLNLQDRRQSYYGRLSYSYADRYVLTATIRRDGSSNFNTQNRWGTFPSFALAWRITEESFMQNQNIFSNLKLRAGWGLTGNSGDVTNRAFNQLTSNRIMYYYFKGTRPFTGAPVGASGLGQLLEIDTDLKWESNSQTNLGLDMAFLKNALTVTVEWYQKDANDLLVQQTLRPSTGYSNLYTNMGKIRNTGVEFLVGYQKTFGDWTLDLKGNLSTNKNEAIDIGTPIYYEEGLSGRNHGWGQYSITKDGLPVGSYYGYRNDGLWQTQEEIKQANDNAAAKYGEGTYYWMGATSPGDRKVVDTNGDGRATADDRVILGDGYADFTYGLNLGLSWKNFDFSAYLYGVAGQDILSFSYRNFTQLLNPGGSGRQNLARSYGNNAWNGAGSTNEYPRLTITDPSSNGQISDAFILKGDFLKISNIQIGYTFPKNWLDVVKMTSARVYVGIDNLATITQYKWGDPEVGNNDPRQTGFDGGRYPFPRVYNFGVVFGF